MSRTFGTARTDSDRSGQPMEHSAPCLDTRPDRNAQDPALERATERAGLGEVVALETERRLTLEPSCDTKTRGGPYSKNTPRATGNGVSLQARITVQDKK